MNNNQRIAGVVSLIIIGLVLLSTMVEYGDGSRIPFAIRIFSFPSYFQEEVFIPWEPAASSPARMAARKYAAPQFGLYVRNGILGILLGLVTPLSLWAVAVYIALESKKIDEKLAIKGGPAAGKSHVTTHDGATFTGATVYEAAVFAKNAGYKAYQIFELNGQPYQPPTVVLREDILPTAVPLVTPPGLRTVAVYIASVSKKIDANLPMNDGPAPGKGEVMGRDKFGNEIGFTGVTVHEAAVKAKAAGYRDIFNKDGTPYQPSAPAKS